MARSMVGLLAAVSVPYMSCARRPLTYGIFFVSIMIALAGCPATGLAACLALPAKKKKPLTSSRQHYKIGIGKKSAEVILTLPGSATGFCQGWA